ncbi:BamA/TamA family outer membrane protein, partial [Treponema endosymbiont of Eucomonympha sp.]|uniref:BamA/TamA family outer membrane protein n=1 Tax=Treponema endosymbiont of Eucomonympha sp. TaxID=1580831 RepID=UPI001EE70CFE
MTFSGVTDPDDWPVSLFLQLSDANVFGTGKNASTSLNVSNNQQSASVGYVDSWFLGKSLSFSVSAEGSRKSLAARQYVYYPDGLDSGHYMDYDQWSFSLSTGLGHRWTPDFAILSLSAGMTNNLIKNNYDSALYEPYYETLISDYHDNPGLKNTVWTAFSIDGRDINYDPSKGWFASQRVGWTGLLPVVENEFFFRTETKAEGYVTLFDFAVSDDWHLKWVLALYSGVSLLFPPDESTISSNSQLYIDGIFNGRGWNDYETYYENRGEALWSNYAEIRMPLVPGMLALDFFMDAITLHNKPADLFSCLSLNDFYFSFGHGLRFTLRNFPPRLLFANKFQLKEGAVGWKKATG